MESTGGEILIDEKEITRGRLEDAIYRALEEGMTQKEIQEEVEYALRNYEEDDD
jgi:hypothetical protein